jgi:AAA domain (dynein-related subfamily)
MTDLIVRPDEIVRVLLRFKNAILEGVPGTGKTYSLSQIASTWTDVTGRELGGDGQGAYAITMHPSTSYEDFVEGLRYDEALGRFDQRDGFILRIVEQAQTNPELDFLVLLDEINRANVPKVLGDLLMTLERTKRAHHDATKGWIDGMGVTLPYSGDAFEMPDNIYVVGTMNTTDQSIAPLDSALRRRFAFIRLEPLGGDRLLELTGHGSALTVDSVAQLTALNERVLRPLLGSDAMMGHSYLIGAEDDEPLKRVWRFGILPQLTEVAHAYGGEDLLDPSTRGEWLAARDEAAPQELGEFDTFLKSLGLSLRIEGTGASRSVLVLDVEPEAI